MKIIVSILIAGFVSLLLFSSPVFAQVTCPAGSVWSGSACVAPGPGGGGSGNIDPITITAPDSIKNSPIGGSIGTLISTVVNAAIILAAILAFVYLIWGGVQWITSGGDKGSLEEARGRITNAIVGLVIVAASWAIFGLVQNILVGQILILN